ncbi:MAG: metal ABC transporter substrate-binding protein [Verrucomicrobiota bacterium]
MNQIQKRFFLPALLTVGTHLSSFGLEIATLHPLLADMASQIGGEKVQVIELIGRSDDPHDFTPSPSTLAKASSARLVVASGKGMESHYLEELKDNLSPQQIVFEAGGRVYSIRTDPVEFGTDHHHHDHEGTIDPHWWHDPDNMRQASRELANVMSYIDPQNRDLYMGNLQSYRNELSLLDDWIEEQVAFIPKERRILVTPHLAFGYFCRKYDFTPVAAKGFQNEQMVSQRELGEILRYLKENDVAAIFTERGMNPKFIHSLAKEAGLPVGGALYADGIGLPESSGYVDMMRSNVETIVTALRKGM